MSRYISENIRLKVAERAHHQCEYCLIPDDRTFFSFHIDHIISLKHGGKTVLENLAYCCQICNLNKGSDVATFLEQNPNPIRFFNPRQEDWSLHFYLDFSGAIVAQTNIGEATIKILELNHPESVIERREMLRLGII